MTMSPLYPCGKPSSTGTHNETVKKLTLLFTFIDRTMVESWLRISNPVGMLLVLQSNRNFSIPFTVTAVIHKSCNLIGTLESFEF